MKSRLNGANAAGDQVSTAHLRWPMVETGTIPEGVVIRWTQTAHERSAELRRDRIAVVAYYLSEARGFVPGYETDDWLLAQAQVDAADAGTFEG